MIPMLRAGDRTRSASPAVAGSPAARATTASPPARVAAGADAGNASGNPGVWGWLTILAALVMEQLADVPADAAVWWAVAGACGWTIWAILWRRVFLWGSRRWAVAGLVSGGCGFLLPVAVTAATAMLSAPTLAGGEGASPEGMLLAVLRAALIAGAVSAASATRMAFTIASTVFLVTLSIIVVDHPRAGLAAAAYALAACGWLAGRHRGTADAGHLPTRVGLAASLTVAAVVASLTGGHASAGRAIAGWLPFSGGDSWAFPWARDGSGDGENLIAARTQPRATGPVDSDMFLTSHQPSLFDMFDDLYGEPPKPRNDRRQRSIALDVPLEQRSRTDEHYADSEHAGRTFSTIRQPTRRRRPGSDITARAVVSVTGPTPVHLRLEVFEQFDGRTWRPGREAAGPSTLDHVGGDWMQWSGRLGAGLEGSTTPAPTTGSSHDRHEIVVGSLRTPTVPLPTLPDRLRIDRIDRADFFRTAAPEVVTLDGVDVPAGTTIQTDSTAAGIDATHWPPVPAAVGGRGGEVPKWVIDLAEAWQLPVAAASPRSGTTGSPADFAVASQIVSELARRCTLDPAAVAPPECDDTLRHFLLESRRGPAYCFAGAATLLLRACGYESRLAGGLYVSGARRDARARRVMASRDDVHMWAEVADRSGRWIPVEATPGVRMRLPTAPWWRRAAAVVHEHVRSGLTATTLALLGGTLLFGLVMPRTWRSIADGLATIAWRMAIAHPRACPLAATWRLVERRAWLAGRPRPAHETARGWYVEACGDSAARSATGFIDAFEAVIYGPRQVCLDRERHLQLARAAAATLTRTALAGERRPRVTPRSDRGRLAAPSTLLPTAGSTAYHHAAGRRRPILTSASS